MRLYKLTVKILRRVLLKYRLLCWAINSKFRKVITISTKQGVFTVALGKKEPIGKSLYTERQYELGLMSNTMAFLRNKQMCPPKGQGTIIDIGANNGVTSVGMLYMGEFERAIAFEPEPRNFSLLQHNTKQNGFSDKIVCLPYAVSDHKGDVLFELSYSNFGDHRVRADVRMQRTNGQSEELYNESRRLTTTVRCDKLDDLLANIPDSSFSQNIAVVWIDVQGYEGYVFMGAKDLLSKGIPVVSEIWPYGILRAGMSQKQYCDIAKSIWSSYWVRRRGKFVRYPIDILDVLFDELGYGYNFDNIIFSK